MPSHRTLGGDHSRFSNLTRTIEVDWSPLLTLTFWLLSRLTTRKMAMAQQTDMDFSPISPLSTASNGSAPTPCEELTAMKSYIRRLQIICNEKEKTVSLLRLDQGHVESDSLYQLAWSEFQDIQGTLQQAVSDFDSLSVQTQAALTISLLKILQIVLLLFLPLGETCNIKEKMRTISNFLHLEKRRGK
ncbi:hypothetical protein TNCV_4923071 [Trichonephila clavipes]|nr:hypothetical protein TNCV_4923071 [Trichonephila clavipes]